VFYYSTVACPTILSGSERWAASYAYDGRLVFTWSGDVITLLDLGTHDEVYG
jgi:mRNA-degrading endonuclease YafQ of YafQ-DinJ toxin-antitoxin module